MKALGKFSKTYLKQVIILVQVYLLVVLGPLCGSTALATPNSPSVVLGSTESIATGNTTQVNLITDKAVINWRGLDTSDGQQLIFDKSGASGAPFSVLNRVTSGGATQFDGILNGNNGHVIIVNPQGIVFGSTSVINAFKFTASGLGVSSADYTSWYNGSGELNFTSGSGSVINNSIDGISAEQVRLIGKNVTNNGTIRTTGPGGLVVMAAGEKVYLAEAGSDVLVDTTWDAGDNAVTNNGTIDAAGGTIRLASGDIFSQAAIEDAASFVAEAKRDITISGPIDAGSVDVQAGRDITLEEDVTIHTTGDIYLWADEIGDTQGDFLAREGADITADAGNVTIRGNEVKLYGAVKAGINESGEVTPDKDLTITGRDCFGGDETEWRNVWAYDILEASRDIIISDTGQTEIATWVPSGKCGGGYWEYSTEYDPGTIHLFGDVTAGRNLELYNDTYTGPDVTFRAGNNVILANDQLETTPPGYCERLTGDTWLALRAGNEIVAPDTVITVTGSTLIMEQGPSIDTKDFEFDNQAATNLTLISNSGSVTSDMAKPENAADKWDTIGATANDDITLSGDGSIRSGDSGTDTSKSLWAKNGNINVNAGGDFSADKNIEAGTDISATAGDNVLLMGNATAGQNIMLAANEDVDALGDITAGANVEISSSDTTTYLGGNVTAGSDITLHNNTVLNGSGSQRIEATTGTLTASKNLDKTTTGNLNLAGGAGINLDGTVDVQAGSLTIEDDVTAAGDILANDDVTLDGAATLDGTANQKIDAENGTLWTKSTITKTGAGNLNLGGQNGINLDGTVDVQAGSLTVEDDAAAAGDLLANDNVTLNGASTLDGAADQRIDAENGTLWAKSTITKTGAGNLNLGGQTGINLDGTVDVKAGSLNIEDDVTAAGDLLANDNVILNGTATLDGGDQSIESKNGVVVAHGTITKTTSGQMSILAADGITLEDAAMAGDSMYLDADTDNDGTGDMLAQSTLTTTNGDIEISASDTTIKLQDNVSAGRDLILNNNTEVAAGKKLDAGRDVTVAADKTLKGKGALTVEADRNITLGGDVTASDEVDGDLVLWADKNADNDGDMTAYGTIRNYGGDIDIYSSDDTTYIGGDVYGGHNITLHNNTRVNGYGDQTLEAGNKLTADGYVRKFTEGDMYLVGNSQGESEISVDLTYDGDGPGTSTYQGNLWILGEEDVQISDDVTTFGDDCVDCEEQVFFSELLGETGGVAIISENGAIYTDGADGALDVAVTGSSDAALGTGVYGFGLNTNNDEAKAAIAIVSAEPLKIKGENARLDASGRYYNDGSVDDRAGINFLDIDAEIPDGVPRDQGEPFDLAIYTASENGSVEIDCLVTITSETIPLPTILIAQLPEQPDAAGAMVIDAYDVVTVGNQFNESLRAGDVGDRLEVASRITEWLEDAVDRLPFPEDLDLPKGYNYVMRGAGAENPEIGDGAPAWVLESRDKEEPFVAAAPIQEPEMKYTGCPALVNWLAGELNLNSDQVQVLFVGSRGATYDIQPCDTCARLQLAARVLMDSDGSRMAALAKVVNEYASAGAPPSEEQMAMIAAALQNPEQGTDYAMASEWLDAMTQYVSILHSDLGIDTADAVAAVDKYVTPVIGGENPAVAAFVSAQLAGISG